MRIPPARAHRQAAPVGRAARLLPGGGGLKRTPQLVIWMRRLVEARPEGFEGLGTHDKQSAIQSRVLGHAADGFEHEVGFALAGELGGAVD